MNYPVLFYPKGLRMVTYSATLDCSREVIVEVAKMLAVHRRLIGTRKGRRALTPFKHAVLVLRWFIDAARMARLALDNNIGLSTSYRYLDEAIDVIADHAPELHAAIAAAMADGATHLILDGTLIESDRVAARDRHTGKHLWYSGKHRVFGGNIQALYLPDGYPIWTSEVLPGSVHDFTAAHYHHILDQLYKAAADGLPTLADSGYQGAGIGIIIPIKTPPGGRLDRHTQTFNKLQKGLRCLGERGNAILKTRWYALHRIRCCPQKIGRIVAAALVLTHLEPHYRH